MSIGFERPTPRTLDDVARPLPPSKGLITLHELRECCAIIARELIAARLRSTSSPRVAASASAPTHAERHGRSVRYATGELQDGLLAYLTQSGQPRTSGELARAVKSLPSSVIPALGHLVKRGRVVRTEHPTKVWRGQPVALYQAVALKGA